MLIHFPKEWIVEVRSSGSYFHTFLSFFFFFQFYRPGDSTPARKEGDIGGLSTPHYNKPQHSKGSTNNFVSPNTVGLKSETSHTAQFEITATRDFINRNTGTKKNQRHRNTANLSVPLLKVSETAGVRKERVSCTRLCSLIN